MWLVSRWILYRTVKNYFEYVGSKKNRVDFVFFFF